ncbi:polynucleotide 3'-phosphatase ZDP-like isoform X2 [Rosa chinensis]|uniref:polynucleotide 3'-phosphatase ZDP-like isoform X2 n=1 Tax=Rosa chinensis TaxID=74649 RepID=UPI001AD8C055|nr:polynucleotide 3'-phosphatase ZDP-like isoform X2 [Rosa chinensis]
MQQQQSFAGSDGVFSWDATSDLKYLTWKYPLFSVSDVKDKYKVFIACGTSQGEDPFRKPKPGLWHMLEQHFNSGISIGMKQSFYVGDAAGRSNDHSDAVLSLQRPMV